MKKYSKLSSAAVVIGTLKIKEYSVDTIPICFTFQLLISQTTGFMAPENLL